MKGQIFESPRGPVLDRRADPRHRAEHLHPQGRARRTASSTTSSSTTHPGREGSGQDRSRADRRRGAAARGVRRDVRSRPMLTLLFDGIAYGMLLFVLAVRAGGDAGADELHQPRARRVRDGRRLRHGAADEPRRRAVPRLPAARLRRCRRCSARVLERTLYRPHVRASRTSTRCCSRSAWSSWRWPRSTTSSARSSRSSSCRRWLQGRFEIARRAASAATGCSSSWSARR